MPRQIAAGNWKMNGLRSDLDCLDAIAAALPETAPQVVLCLPATLLAPATARGLSGLHIGAQDCHGESSGAYTGDISAAMVADSGATHVILGHSERRSLHRETDADIRSKVAAAWDAGLTAILCLGETEAERDAGNTLEVIGAQLAGSLPDAATDSNIVIAYEPVWAIGTGRQAEPAQIAEVHDYIRAKLTDRFGRPLADSIPLLYGGSVKAGNATAIFDIANVDGALVGGASLKAADFNPIVAALAQS